MRCSVTLWRNTSVTLWRNTSVTFGGRRSRLKHPGSVGVWVWVAGAGKGTLQCDVVWQAQHQCDIWWQAQSIEVPGSVGAWLWVAGAGNGTLQYDIARQRSTIWWQAQLPLYNLVPRNISVQQTSKCA